MPDETPPASINRELTAKITAAYVRQNQIASDQLAALISTVHQALASLGKPPPEPSVERTPAVPIRDPFTGIMSFASNVDGAARSLDGISRLVMD